MYQKILVPIDGSTTATAGLDEAIKLARVCGARLRLLHLVDEPARSAAPVSRQRRRGHPPSCAGPGPACQGTDLGCAGFRSELIRRFRHRAPKDSPCSDRPAH